MTETTAARAIGDTLEDVLADLPGIDLELDPVIIVGAGPVGMTAALTLAYYGIRSILLDDDNKLSYGSRAIAIHRSTLEVWEKWSSIDDMLANGMAWQVRRTYFRNTELFRQQMPPVAPGTLPTFINLQQCHTEAFLLKNIQATRLVDLLWLHKVQNLEQDATGVTLEVKTMQGLRRIRGSYVLGCDGAHSTVRHLLNMPFPGTTHPDFFLIADIR
ncbi:MAG TPA: FAD-dependent monooxygenase, partial [Chloroflexia bacterium]|nr:FAD-dependent monooxygenase [Chloroflexia bacterium]